MLFEASILFKSDRVEPKFCQLTIAPTYPLTPSSTPKKHSQTHNPMSYCETITIKPDKRGGKSCIRRMRITVYDVLGWLAAGMTHEEILDDFPELTEQDIRACLKFAADHEQ